MTQCLEFRVKSLGFRVSRVVFRVFDFDSGFRIKGLVVRV